MTICCNLGWWTGECGELVSARSMNKWRNIIFEVDSRGFQSFKSEFAPLFVWGEILVNN